MNTPTLEKQPGPGAMPEVASTRQSHLREQYEKLTMSCLEIDGDVLKAKVSVLIRDAFDAGYLAGKQEPK